jgi:hypothetical protein
MSDTTGDAARERRDGGDSHGPGAGDPAGDAGGFPGIGHVYEVDYGGDFKFRMAFESQTRMRLRGLQGDFAVVDEVLEVSIITLRPQLYLVSWHESNGTTVAEVHDFENGIAYVNATTPEGAFERMSGPLKKVG